MTICTTTRRSELVETVELVDELEGLVSKEEYPQWWMNGSERMKWKMEVTRMKRKISTMIDSENFK